MKKVKNIQQKANSRTQIHIIIIHVKSRCFKKTCCKLILGWRSFILLTLIMQREMLLFLFHLITFIGLGCEFLLPTCKNINKKLVLVLVLFNFFFWSYTNFKTRTNIIPPLILGTYFLLRLFIFFQMKSLSGILKENGHNLLLREKEVNKK